MALWAVSNPLIMPNDFNKVRPDVREVMQQKEIMAAYKDAMAVQGKRVYKVRGNEYLIWIFNLQCWTTSNFFLSYFFF